MTPADVTNLHRIAADSLATPRRITMTTGPADYRPPASPRSRHAGWLTLALGAWLAVMVALAVALVLTGHAGTDDRDPRTLPPCAHEDGSGGPVPCVWIGTEQGNLVGRSYVVNSTDPWSATPVE